MHLNDLLRPRLQYLYSHCIDPCCVVIDLLKATNALLMVLGVSLCIGA